MEILQPYIYLYAVVIGAFLYCLYRCDYLEVRKRKDGSITDMRFKRRSKKIDQRVFLIVATIVLLFIATRDKSVGTDTKSYVYFYESPVFWYNGDKTDLLFEYFGRLVHLFEFNSEGFIFISAAIYCSGLYFVIWKTANNRMYSLLLFMIAGTSSIFFFLYLSMIRQALALGYFFFAMYILFDSNVVKPRRYIYAGLLYLVVLLTHGSSLFAIPFIFMAYYMPVTSKRVWMVVILVSYMMSALDISLVKSILGFVFSYANIGHYSGYENVDFGMIDAKGWFNMNLLPFMVLSFFIIYVSKKSELKDYKIQFALWSVVMNNIFYDNLMWSRLILYLSLYMVIALPNALYRKQLTLQLPTLCFVLIYYIYKTTSQLISQAISLRAFSAMGNIIIPYQSWLWGD